MGSTSDFVSATLADALLPLFRRPVEDVILETLDRRQIPSRTDFKELRDLVNSLRGQLTGATGGVKKLAERTEEVEATLAAIESKLDALGSGSGAATVDVDAAVAAALAPILARLDALESARLATAAPTTAKKATAKKPAAKKATAKKATAKKPAAKKAAAKKPATKKPAAKAAAAAACKVSDCDGKVRAKGFCSRHYQQWRRGSLAGFPPAS